MRVLLIVAPYYYPHSQAQRNELLGILYLVSSIRSKGHDVSILDPTIESPKRIHDGTYYYGISEEELRRRISAYHPDIVGISCNYAYSHQEAYKIAIITKEIKSEITTVMGGVFASIYKEKILSDCKSIDYVLMGESEHSFCQLLSELSLMSPALDKIDGLLFRKDNKIFNNEKKLFIDNLDSLPFPARDIIDTKRYMNTKSVMHGLGTRPALSLLTSRSCPNCCSFCNMWLVHGNRWRPRSPENILWEIDEIINKYKAEHVFIMDDNFTFDPNRVKIICDGIIKKGYHFKWNTPSGISVKRIDSELTHLMKRAGCANVCVGIESGSEYIRNTAMKKNVSNEEIINAVKHFNSAKIPVGGFIILGMPEENEDHFQETINFVKRLKLSFIMVSFASPFPGTKLYRDLIKEGIINESYLPKFDNLNHAVFSTKYFAEGELSRNKKKLLLQFHLSHIPDTLAEFFGGRLNWISIGMMRRFFAETLFEPGTYKQKLKQGSCLF